MIHPIFEALLSVLWAYSCSTLETNPAPFLFWTYVQTTTESKINSIQFNLFKTVEKLQRRRYKYQKELINRLKQREMKRQIQKLYFHKQQSILPSPEFILYVYERDIS